MVMGTSLESILGNNKKLGDFVWAEKERPAVAHNYYVRQDEFPVVDMDKLKKNDKKELVRMRDAASEWGFFVLKNHGVQNDIVHNAEKEGRKLFELPLERKQAAAWQLGLNMECGYSCSAQLKNTENLTWKETFQLPGRDPKLFKQFIQKLWPQGNPKYCCAMDSFGSAMSKLFHDLLELLILALGVNPGFLRNLCDWNNETTIRFNYYPPCPQPFLTLGTGPHSDPPLLTLLHQDEVGGLQIFKDNEWISVKPQAGTIFVNVGDALQVVSNDLYKSVLHRAVLNSSRSRMSISCFLIPALEAEIHPPKELINDKNPLRYKKFTWLEYRRTLRQHRIMGKNILDHFRV